MSIRSSGSRRRFSCTGRAAKLQSRGGISSFELDDSYAEWYETQVQELTGLYGKPDRQTVNTLDALGMTNWSCAWDTEETSLQFLLITREHGEATAVLGAAEMSRETGTSCASPALMIR